MFMPITSYLDAIFVYKPSLGLLSAIKIVLYTNRYSFRMVNPPKMQCTLYSVHLSFGQLMITILIRAPVGVMLFTSAQ